MTLLITSHLVLILSILTTIGTLAGAGEKVLPGKAAAVCGVVATVAIDALRILDIFAPDRGEPPTTPPAGAPALLTTGHDKIYPITEDTQPDIPVYHFTPRRKGLLFAPSLAAMLIACNGSPVNSPEEVEVTGYSYEQGKCIDNAHDKGEADACRALVKAKYCAMWKAADAGVDCNLDGGK